MNLLPLELFELILDDHRIKIFDIQLVSKYFLFVIRNILVINIQICLDSNTVCHHVINNFKFRNLSIGWACDVNSFIDELKKLSFMELTNAARRLGIVGASLMAKDELVKKIDFVQEKH